MIAKQMINHMPQRFVTRHWTDLIEANRTPPLDPKTGLQEWAQARGLPLPVYSEVGREGPAHEPVFTIEVTLEGHGAERAEGPSKRAAERDAAERLLARVEAGRT